MNTLDFDTLTLAAGCHDPGDEMCVMEAVAFIAGEEWTDQPECASPVIGAFMRAWNDVLDDDPRQDLKRYIPRLVGSKGTPEQENLRGWMALDWLVRVHTPAWLRIAGLDKHADRLAGFAEIRPDTVRRVKPALNAAWDAAEAAATRAAWDVAGDTATVAVGAAEIAAWDAVGTTAWGTARGAVWDTGMAAARGTAWDIARAAERVASRDAKELTRRELEQSAHELVDRMLAVTEGDPA